MKGKIFFGVLAVLLAAIATLNAASAFEYSLYFSSTEVQNSTFGIYAKFNTSQKINFSTLENENTVSLPAGYVPVAFGIGNFYNSSDKTSYKMNIIQFYVKGAKLNDDGTIDYDDTVEVSTGDTDYIQNVIELPEDYVVVGYGVAAKRINPGKNMEYSYLEVYARKLYPANEGVSKGLSSTLYTFKNGKYLQLEGSVLLSSGYIAQKFGGRSGGWNEARPSKLQISGQKLKLNTIPVISNIGYIGVYEGDRFVIHVNAFDPDGDPISITCGEPFTESCEWNTESGDAGEYEVEVSVSDGKSEVTGSITVIVKEKEEENHAPRIISVSLKSNITEGDFVRLNVTATDPDGDELTITCSEPFEEDCEWQTEIGDAGTYEVEVTASDGELEDSMTIYVTVNEKAEENNAPVIEDISYAGEYEGDHFIINVDASDEDGDDLTITCSEPFEEDCEWQTEIGDAGTYEVEVSVSDGNSEVTGSITVIVREKEEPPINDTTAPEITVYEPIDGETYNSTTINLKVSANEPIERWYYVLDDGDEIDFTPNTTLGDLEDGEHTITIYAEDYSGNVGEETVDFIIDTNETPEEDEEAPVCSVDYIENKQTNNKYYLDDIFYISEKGEFYAFGMAIDELSDIIKVQFNRTSQNDYWLWDDAAASDGAFNELEEGWKTDFNDNEFTDGIHQVCCRATDSANNDDNPTCATFCIDTLNPKKVLGIELISDEDEAPAFEWDAAEDNGCAGIDYYEVEVHYPDHTHALFTTSSESWTISDATQKGYYYIKVRAIDNAGNIGEWGESEHIYFNNSAPTIDLIFYTGEYEGDNFIINVDASDEDGDILTISYGAPFGSDGEWQTQDGDAGTYSVLVTVSDGKVSVTRMLTVTVRDKITPPNPENHAPIINGISYPSNVEEGERVKVIVNASDEDGDLLLITYGLPLNSQGEWQTRNGDEGTYDITITVSDGKTSATAVIRITVSDDNHGGNGGSGGSISRSSLVYNEALTQINQPITTQDSGLSEIKLLPREETYAARKSAGEISWAFIFLIAIFILLVLIILTLLLKR